MNVTPACCRLCTAEVPSTETLDLTEDVTLYQEICTELSMFNGIDTNILFPQHSPKMICQACNASLLVTRQFIQKLIFTQQMYQSNGSSNQAEVNKNREFDTKADKPVKLENCHRQNNDGNFTEAFDFEIKPDLPVEVTLQQGNIKNPDINLLKEVKSETALKNDNILAKHSKSWASYKWLCSRCRKVSLDIRVYRQHCIEVHKVCCAFKCEDCGETVDSFELFVDHVRQHRQMLCLYCEYCNIILQPESAKSHKETHTYNEQRCPNCGDVFDNLLTLKQHINEYDPKKRRKKIRNPPPAPLPPWQIEKFEDKSWNGYEWTCQTCDKIFDHVDRLREHTKRSHDMCFAMKCVDCTVVLDCYRGFVDHVRKHRPFLQLHCHYCNHRFDDPHEEKHHVAQHFGPTSRQCVSCGTILPNQILLQQHIARYKPPPPKCSYYFGLEKPVTVNDLTCQICDMVLKSQYLLRKHITQKHVKNAERKKDYMCDVCGKGFYTELLMRQHRSLHNDRSELCKICMNMFPTVSHLKIHVKNVHTKTNSRVYQCDICSKVFKAKGNLVIHIKTHVDAMPFTCQYCERAFKRKEYLRNHMLQHTGERPYQCRECQMSFASWGNCNKHMSRIHHKTLAKTKRVAGGSVPVDTAGRPVVTSVAPESEEWAQLVIRKAKRGPKKKEGRNE